MASEVVVGPSVARTGSSLQEELERRSCVVGLERRIRIGVTNAAPGEESGPAGGLNQRRRGTGESCKSVFFILETDIAEKRKDIQGQFLTPAQTLDGLKQDLDIWHAAHHNKIFHLVHHPFETD